MIVVLITGHAHFDLSAYESFRDGGIHDEVVTDQQLEALPVRAARRSRAGRSPVMSDLPLEQLRPALRGVALAPGEPGYDEARSVYNASIDRRPAVIVRCLGTADVVQAVRFAARRRPAGGGTRRRAQRRRARHLRRRTADRPVPDARRPGRPGQPDGSGSRAAPRWPTSTTRRSCSGSPYPTGQVSETGVGGLALNGGMGMLQRRFGLTCDNLRSAQVVTATGEVVIASETSHPDLFWALRGGGGNFGVVTSFEFQAHRVGPIILAGLVGYPVERAPEVLAALRDFIVDAPEELSADALFMHAPPLPVVPPEHHGSLVIGIFLRYSGRPGGGLRGDRPAAPAGRIAVRLRRADAVRHGPGHARPAEPAGQPPLLERGVPG